MVTNEFQAESVLYGESGAVSALPVGASVILSSTVSTGFVTRLEQRLLALVIVDITDEHKDLKLVDAPVSGGVKRAADGTLTIMASGTDEALKHAGSVLSALSENLYIIKGGCGAGSSVKMINQLLAGIHIAASAEAMAFGARLGLNTRILFEIVTHTKGTSWMFENRVPHMLDNDYTPYSALDIFVKDLGIVTRESTSRKVPLHLSTVAYQLYIAGSAAGWGRCDDAGVVKSHKYIRKSYKKVQLLHAQGPKISRKDSLKGMRREERGEIKTKFKEDEIELGNKNKHQEAISIQFNLLTVSPFDLMHSRYNLYWSHPDMKSRMVVSLQVYEKLTGVAVEGKLPELRKEDLLNSLPPEWPEDPFNYIHQMEANSSSKVLVVLDDDPTGTQTVHDIEAISLTKDICRNIDIAAKSVENIGYTVVLRGDSTLRGHFPEEADAAVSVLGKMDAWIICPFFLQGGRYTIEDVHYVADGERLVPAGETEFSKDAVFGYRSSNLREWVEEKTKGRVPATSVSSISIELLRKQGPTAVCEQLCNLQQENSRNDAGKLFGVLSSLVIIAKELETTFMKQLLFNLQAEMKGKRFLCRTAASFVSARIGIKQKAPISPKALGIGKEKYGGLIVVGSYVPKTTRQVEELQSQCGHFLKSIEISVDKLAMNSLQEREEEISRTVEMADVFLRSRKDTLIVTTRELIKGKC
ncbi:hypothetical protein ACLOJK_007204 [Asimina triloba]